MKFEEVLPALRDGKKVRRKAWGENDYIAISSPFELSDGSLMRDDWEIVEEPKPPKLLAPAMYHTDGQWVLGRTLFGSKKEAQEYHGDRQVIWPAIPNKDGMYEVP
jgi:hypothetical protein